MRKFFFSFVVLVVVGGAASAQDYDGQISTVLGRPAFTRCATPPASRACAQYFLDEIIVSRKSSSYEPSAPSAMSANAGISGADIENFVSHSRSLKGAMEAGLVREVKSHYNLGSAEFRESDRELHRKFGLDRFYNVRVTVHSGDEIQKLADRLSADPEIESVSLSPVVKVADGQIPPADPLYPKQWGVFRVHAPEAWSLTEGNPEVNYVFFLDTGLEATHPDLKKPFFHYDTTASPEKELPKDFLSDDFGHGTFTYGEVCAQHNDIGIAGLLPNANCAAVKVLKMGFGAIEWIDDGILVAAAKCREIRESNPRARCVANASLGVSGAFPSMEEAVKTAASSGLMIVAAAGNAALDIDAASVEPAGIPGVIAVAASDEGDSLAFFSNYGRGKVAIAAPGVDICSTTTLVLGPMANATGYTCGGGTSFSAPFVTAAVAAVQDLYPAAGGEEIKSRILLFADGVDALRGKVASGGVLDIAKALAGHVRTRRRVVAH